MVILFSYWISVLSKFLFYKPRQLLLLWVAEHVCQKIENITVCKVKFISSWLNIKSCWGGQGEPKLDQPKVP